MKQVLVKSGSVIVEDVPPPKRSKKNILVRVMHSCISVGTEMTTVNRSNLPLYQRALKEPDKVKRVIEMIRDQGFKTTIDRVQGKLSSGTATGYSVAGEVIEVGEDVEFFSVGDRVACGGAGIANHAEIIDVPVNLAVKIPNNLETTLASTVTLGSIAIQGVRRAKPTLGEVFVVFGLGVLGQMTVQILKANGCEVIGIDPDKKRVQLAIDNGIDLGISSNDENYINHIFQFTNGIGADAAIITASSESNEIISGAMNACRKKGRVVLVGDVGLKLTRSDFYKKELDFFISTSYGPGRYDPYYEEEGLDYPISYVRWTENRNMQTYIDLLDKKKINLVNLYSSPYPINKASEAYDSLKVESNKPLIVLLEYPKREQYRISRIKLRDASVNTSKIRIAVAGASSFAQSTHLPNILKLKDSFKLYAVMSRTGTNARAVAKQYNSEYCTSEYEDILKDENVDLIMITTRHDLHGSMVIKALEAGKHVFVEKPLSLKEEEINYIENFIIDKPKPPLLMVGFNRRFSPAIQKIHTMIKDRRNPIIVNYTMNVGYIPTDHWIHGKEGGGRNIGEACHIYDLFNFLIGNTSVKAINAFSITPKSSQWKRNDNFVTSLKYTDGSLCNLTYTALGNKSYPKERLEIFVDGKVIIMDNFKEVIIYGAKEKIWSSKVMQKGLIEELKKLSSTLLHETSWPISLEEQIQASKISFEVEKQIYSL